jgi:hypothetical protein
MSCRPSAIRRHRSERGDVAALSQWHNRVRRNPKEGHKLSVTQAMALILEGSPEPVTFERLKVQILLLVECGAVSSPKPSRKEMLAAIAQFRKAL